MSTAKKLGGKQYAALKENRIGALRFYAQMAKTRGAVGIIARRVLQRLLQIHRAPQLSNSEKDHEFRVAIRIATPVIRAAEQAVAEGPHQPPLVDAPEATGAEPNEGLPAGSAVPEA